MLRVKNEKELAALGLRLHPTHPNQLIRAPDCDRTPASQAPSVVPNTKAEPSPIVGPDILALITQGQTQWKKIKDTEKYLTGAHYDFGCTLQAIKDWYGDDDKAWAKAYRGIAMPPSRRHSTEKWGRRFL